MKPTFTLFTAQLLAPLAALHADKKPTPILADSLVETVSERLRRAPRRYRAREMWEWGQNRIPVTCID